MDWGKGIVITLIVFISLMVGLVTICVKQDDIHLVTQNYYEEEIKYQDQIDKMINANSLGYKVLNYDNLLKKVDLNPSCGIKGDNPPYSGHLTPDLTRRWTLMLQDLMPMLLILKA
jgi:hypothetical protein